VSVYEPESGFLAARRACEAVLDVFLKQEVNIDRCKPLRDESRRIVWTGSVSA